jgi:hypothetical protein
MKDGLGHDEGGKRSRFLDATVSNDIPELATLAPLAYAIMGKHLIRGACNL